MDATVGPLTAVAEELRAALPQTSSDEQIDTVTVISNDRPRELQAGAWPVPLNALPTDGLPLLPSDRTAVLQGLRATNKLQVYACTWNMHAKVRAASDTLTAASPACLLLHPLSLTTAPSPLPLHVPAAPLSCSLHQQTCPT